MNSFIWQPEYPDDDEVFWDLLFRKTVFSTWFAMDKNYKRPVIKQLEFVYIDGRITENYDSFLYGKKNLLYSPYAVENEQIVPIQLHKISPEFRKKLESISEKRWRKLLDRFVWQKVDDNYTLGRDNHRFRAQGHDVFKHPKWDSVVAPSSPFVKDKIANFCRSEELTPIELLVAINDL